MDTDWEVTLLSHVRLCNPMDCSPPGFSVHGVFQARILEWVAISFSRRSSRPRDWTWFSCIGKPKLIQIETKKKKKPFLKDMYSALRFRSLFKRKKDRKVNQIACITTIRISTQGQWDKSPFPYCFLNLRRCWGGWRYQTCQKRKTHFLAV